MIPLESMDSSPADSEDEFQRVENKKRRRSPGTSPEDKRVSERATESHFHLLIDGGVAMGNGIGKMDKKKKSVPAQVRAAKENMRTLFKIIGLGGRSWTRTMWCRLYWSPGREVRENQCGIWLSWTSS